MSRLWIISIGVGTFTTGLAYGWWLGTGTSDRLVDGNPLRHANVTQIPVESVQSFSDNSPSRAEFSSRLNDVLRHRSPLRRARMIDSIAEDLNAAEILGALKELEKTPIREKNAILIKLLARWGELEPEAAMEYARALPQEPGADAIKAVVRSWANRRLKAAEDWIEKQPNSWAKSVARNGLVDAVSERDPERAFSIAQKTGSPYYIEIFERWGARDPQAAATHAALAPPGYSRDSVIQVVAKKWAETDIESALAWAQSLPANNGRPTSIERRDPRPLASVLETWIGKDAEAAMRWLEQLPEDTAKTDVLAVLTKSLSDTDPARAVDVAAMMQPGKSQDNTLRQLIEKWSNKDFSGALAWAQDQIDPEVRRALLPPLVSKLAGQDTEAALQLALSIGEKDGERAVSDVLGHWAAKALPAAAAWVEAQPFNPEYSARIAASWARNDKEGAAQWINRIPAGPDRDKVLGSVIDPLIWQGQHQVAVEWAEGITDDGLRQKVWLNVAVRWLRADPDVARTWIEQSSFPASLKARLLPARSK